MLDELINDIKIHSTVPPITEVYYVLNSRETFTVNDAEKYEANKHLFDWVDKKSMAELIVSLNERTEDDLKSVILLYEKGEIRPRSNVAKNWKS
jgi:hypothetical protein